MKLTNYFRRDRASALLLVVVQIVFLISVFGSIASAAQITARKLTLSSSSAASSNATTSYTFNFTLPSSTVLQSLSADICTTASGTCTTPTGFSNSSSTLSSQPTNLGDASGWTVNTATAGSLRLSKSGNTAAPSGSQTIVFGNVQNPTTANQTFYARITTYSAANWTSAVDTGVVAASTANQISITASIDESLTFCTGTSGITTSSCAGATGSTVALGTLSASATNSGLSQIGVGTNSQSGYVITVNGSTLTSGANTITALSTQAASSTGTKQFGLNLRANSTPSVGADPDGSGTATPSANYNTANQYRFVSGDTVASSAGTDLFRRFQVSYIANIDVATAAGAYTTSLSYICTPTF